MERGRKESGPWARGYAQIAAWVWIFQSALQVATAQEAGWITWETEHVVWCGKEGVWDMTWGEDSLPVHLLRAPSAGRQILWGCPTSSVGAISDSAWSVKVFWAQNLAGSNSNRSALRWAMPPSTSAAESALHLATSLEADWLDDMGSVEAGENGSDDPLRCQAPFLPAWDVEPDCHSWAEPFEFMGTWTWDISGRWTVDARDARFRSQRWLDTASVFEAAGPRCIGIDILHTSSNGHRWAFGWRPNSPTSESHAFTAHHWELQDSTEIHLVKWPVEPEVHGLELRSPCPDSSPVVLSAVPHSCENTYSWELPCPVQAGEAVHCSLGDHGAQLWRDGTEKLEEGDLAFTEIMADPTPALHAPESSYLEVLNTSNYAIDPIQLWLEDSGDFHALQWVLAPPGGLIPPVERFVVADVASAWIEAHLEGTNVLRAAGWSGLRDEGEDLALVGPQGQLESVRYFKNWWGQTAQDGIALSVIHPDACDHSSNWKPDPEGASPGMASTFERDLASIQQETLTAELVRAPEHRLVISPHPVWDPSHPLNVTFKWSNISQTFPLVSQWSESGLLQWESPWPWSDPHQVHMRIDGIHLCHPADTTHLDTLWVGHRPPHFGDVVLTEVLPASHPVVGAEFLEWTNVSDDTLSWKTRSWFPGMALLQSSHPRSDFAVWMGHEWWGDSLSCLWEELPELSLSNASGHVNLVDDWERIIASSEYHSCGHTNRQREKEGRSMERVPWQPELGMPGRSRGGNAWRSSPNDKGMTPGTASSWPDSASSHLVWPSHGVKQDKWVMTVPPQSDLSWWSSSKWDPSTDWHVDWHHGVLLAVASWGPDLIPVGPRHLEVEELSFPQQPYGGGNPDSGVPLWNEILIEPSPEHDAFVEVYMPGFGAWTSEWAWSSDPWANASDFTAVSEVEWWLPEKSEMCLASCPGRVEYEEWKCVPADVPSLHGDRVLTLLTPQAEVHVDLMKMEEQMAKSFEGQSLARIPHSEIWSLTPTHMMATPGAANGPEHLDTSSEHGTLECSPRTIQPGSAHHWGVVELTWTMSDESNRGMFECEFGVRDLASNQPMQWHDAVWSEQGVTWTWDGCNREGIIQPPGTYVGWIQWRNMETGKRGKHHCLIALAPP